MNNKKKNLKIILFKGIWKNLTSRRRKQLIILPILITFAGISEMFSIASVIPFLSALSQPEKANEILALNFIFKFFQPLNITDPFFLSILIFLISVSVAGSLRLLTIFGINFFSAAVGSDFSKKAYRLSLNQPYETHIKRNSSAIISSIISNTDRIVSVIVSFLNLLTSIVIGLALILSLFFINWILSISIAFIFISLYLLLGILLKKRLNKVSKSRASLTKLQTKALQEGLSSFRDIILDNSQELYVRIFSRNDKPLRFMAAKSDFIAASPRYIFELLTLYVIMFIAYIYSTYTGLNNNLLPLLGSIILGLQRLLPAFQIGYASWVNITTNINSVLDLIKLLDQPESKKINFKRYFIFKDEIKLTKITFSYLPNSKNILENFNLTIKKGDRIGIIGESGSGKSTIADIIMGLLIPKYGKIQVDGINLHQNSLYTKEDWYRNISHVPQDIYLADNNIAENIAFGTPFEKIDKNKLDKAIKASNLTDLCKNSNQAFKVKVGERGMQLSGGQRQRIGIARAIYKGGDILILDEATSALDVKTEKKIMETIDNLSSSLTILIITHRLSTLSSCDKVIDISKKSA